jgi:hypothetical protein
MKIIILAPENDSHTIPIKWSLEKAGYEVACWPGLGWEKERQASLLLGDEVRVMLGGYAVQPGDVVWVRRPEDPLPNPKVTEADRKFAEQEYRSFYLNVVYLLERLPVWCINKYSSSRMINNKSVQLLVARECGLQIPPALMSNSPQAVKSFFDERAGSQLIYKGFLPHIWNNQSTRNVAITRAVTLTREQLPADHVLTYAPGIYQQIVAKRFDVRMVLLGNRIYSHAVRTPKDALDWRYDAAQGNASIEPIETPPEIEQSVLSFARQFGICFGSLDFAVDDQGHWWFLEINEEGQFLWLDQANPGLKLQEKFCAFITAPEGSSQPLEERQDLFPSIGDYMHFIETEQKSIPMVAGNPNFVSTERQGL